MSDPFVAEIRMFAGNFAPKGWATCDGQLLPLSQNTALFSLLGTFYGGNGQSTFALPDLQNSYPMFWGDGAGLSQRSLGEVSGSETVTLLTTELPSHNHQAMAHSGLSTQTTPTANVWSGSNVSKQYLGAPDAGKFTHPLSLSISGSSFPHNNVQPYLTVLFIIALQGVFPPRQ
jgi:microcystin-dependent protein